MDEKDVGDFRCIDFIGSFYSWACYPGDIITCIITVLFKLRFLLKDEMLKFTGIPNLPELFRRIRLRDPLKQKQLLKGLVQLSEEGAKAGV